MMSMLLLYYGDLGFIQELCDTAHALLYLRRSAVLCGTRQEAVTSEERNKPEILQSAVTAAHSSTHTAMHK
jgi:hypothetical protein